MRGLLPSYARSAAALVPGASRLPFVPGGGADVPGRELRATVAVDRLHLADYQEVCGYSVSRYLPPAYPHVLAFGMHMALMSDGRFPFGPVGLVHVANRITACRRIDAGEELGLVVRATPLQPHPKGRTFGIVTEAFVGAELVWEEESTMLRRGEGGAAQRGGMDRESPASVRRWTTWELGGDLGRRYAAVSGDRNPIHLHAWSARLFGFRRPIAHGMWTLARCLAAIPLPGGFTATVAFKRPILLPARVEFGHAGQRFVVRDHLEGTLA